MICLNNTDTLEGGASVNAVVDYTVHGLVGTSFTQIAQGQLSNTNPSVLYTAGAAISIVSVIYVNTHSAAVTVDLYLDPANAGTPRRMIPKNLSLGIGYSAHFDGQRLTIIDPGAAGGVANNYLSIAASVSSKILTVALKGEDGNDPSATNLVTIAFRDETLTTGTPNVRTVTGATSVALASGGTLGFTAALAGRIYVWGIDNAGTVELALSRTADIFPESNLVTTVAIGSGSDLATAMYSTTQRTSLACRCIGYVEITTGGTAGEWDNAATKVQVMHNGVKRTGDVVQEIYYQTGATVDGTTAIPGDDTIPQITEGTELMTLAITPTSLINKLNIECVADITRDEDGAITLALFQDAIAGALAAVNSRVVGTTLTTTILKHQKIAGTVSATTFRIRGGQHGVGTFRMNMAYTARMFGGICSSNIKITEVMA